MKEISVPKPSALWDKYHGFPIYYLRQQWFVNRNIMTAPNTAEEVTKEDRIVAWVYLMVLTELLKTRKYWDKVTHRPMVGGA